MEGSHKYTISISSINVGAYMIGEMDVSWKNVYCKRVQICEKIIKKCLENKVDIICTQEDLLLSDSTNTRCEVEFLELYTTYGYIPLSQCILHDNTSQTLQGLYPNREVKMGNVIYVYKPLVYHVIPIPQIVPTTVCAAYCMIYGSTKLVNVHLCGGRYDDQTVFQDETTYMEKLGQVRKIQPSTIICGDLNSTRYYGKPGGLRNWEYPTFLAKSAIFQTIHSPPKNSNKKDNHYSLTIDEKMKWETWQCAPVESLFSHPTLHYTCCFDNDELKKIGETSYRGKCIVDWIFYNSRNVQCIESKVIKLYGNTLTALSDHHMIFANFLIHHSN
jgi:endonuclease/exonuclease/phosphatase family metal-dependent hydrolase